MKIIPFYLPQYHSIPENDEWWGKGFTEWVNVKNARPIYKGHIQPVTPMNNNYYDLLDDEVKKWQISIARENGIYGFCFYHYWFNGHLLLEKPIEQFLNNKELDFPFCLCWANPDWTKIWAGKGSEVLIKQDYSSKEDMKNHVDYLIRFFSDSRYIKENGKPLFVIYSPSEIPNLEELTTYIRQRVKEEGFPGIKLIYQYYVDEQQDKIIRPLFDYRIMFQPVNALHEIENESKKGTVIKLLHCFNNVVKRMTGINASDYLLKVRKSSYDDVWKKILNHRPKDKKEIAGAFVKWDNTPRRGKSGRVMVGATPEKFKNYMSELIKKVKKEYESEYIFITAWNEWSEGSYLEPDSIYLDKYLKAIKEAIKDNE